MDLSRVLPGAKLVIRKFTLKGRQLNIQAQLTGPRTVSRIELQAKLPGSERFNASAYDRKSSVSGNEATRLLQIQGYGFSEDEKPLAGPFVLEVRYPEDLKRERVKFKLKGMDLL